MLALFFQYSQGTSGILSRMSTTARQPNASSTADGSMPRNWFLQHVLWNGGMHTCNRALQRARAWKRRSFSVVKASHWLLRIRSKAPYIFAARLCRATEDHVFFGAPWDLFAGTTRAIAGMLAIQISVRSIIISCFLSRRMRLPAFPRVGRHGMPRARFLRRQHPQLTYHRARSASFEGDTTIRPLPGVLRLGALGVHRDGDRSRCRFFRNVITRTRYISYEGHGGGTVIIAIRDFSDAIEGEYRSVFELEAKSVEWADFSP